MKKIGSSLETSIVLKTKDDFILSLLNDIDMQIYVLYPY